MLDQVIEELLTKLETGLPGGCFAVASLAGPHLDVLGDQHSVQAPVLFIYSAGLDRDADSAGKETPSLFSNRGDGPTRTAAHLHSQLVVQEFTQVLSQVDLRGSRADCFGSHERQQYSGDRSIGEVRFLVRRQLQPVNPIPSLERFDVIAGVTVRQSHLGERPRDKTEILLLLL